MDNSDDSVCAFIVPRAISCIDDVLNLFDEVDYMIIINPLDQIIEIHVNTHQSYDNNFYSNEYIKVSKHCNLNKIQKEIIKKINKYYSEEGKKITQKYVTTYQITKF